MARPAMTDGEASAQWQDVRRKKAAAQADVVADIAHHGGEEFLADELKQFAI